MEFLFFSGLAALGLLGALGCLFAILFLFVRLGRRSEPTRAASTSGCLLSVGAAFVFLVLGGLGLLAAGGLLLTGVVVHAGTDLVERVEFELLPAPEAEAYGEWHQQARQVETAVAGEAGSQAAPTPRGEVVLRATLRGRLPSALRHELEDRIQHALGRGDLPPLRIEEPPGLDVTLIEVLLPITAEEAVRVQQDLESALSDLRELKLELQAL